ncbi:ParA family protein [Sulfitobacter sp. R18_1]|uniref:ParA family protein n=1 Tax=Sulfitobacter sp. R18_1 TaxID=2821104 RepID=UPI001AD97960|nr:ParA family protein [Sulfitobacter sp. R18_1]MBO9429683.1 ParA family protein [Sulfitobacter sp. R18_1]
MKVISFVNMKGGVGKTTLAVNVADVLSRRLDKRVLLVDLDPQFNATQSLYGGEAYLELRKSGADTIYDVFANPAPIISAVKGATTPQPKKLSDITPTAFSDSLHVLLGNLEIYRVEMGGGQGTEMRLKGFLKHKIDDYDYVIIDTPPTPSVFMSSALLASDFYVVPVKPEPMSRVGIDLLQGVINRVSENNGHDIRCVGVVITMAQKNTVVYKDCLRQLQSEPKWRKRLLRHSIPQRTAIAREQGNQRLILDVNDTDANRAIVNVVAEIVKKTDDT